MIEIDRSTYGIPIKDIFFANSVDDARRPSPIRFFQQTTQFHPHFKPVQTSLIDLTAPENQIMAPISKNTRYKIQRAEREGLTPRLTTDPTPQQCAEFASYYDQFAKQKMRPQCNHSKLKALREASALIVSTICDNSGETLAAHTFVRDRQLGRVRLLYSASLFRGMSSSSERNRVGRANRLLHWYEISTLKGLGYNLYDLGGIPLDTSDTAKNAIAKFKLEFGGTLRTEYNGLLSTNLLGKLILPIARMRLQ